jgi:translation initiation factor IF-1
MNKKNHKQHYESTTEPEREDRMELEGIVVEALPATMFKIKCPGDHIVLATLAGKLRLNKIRINVDDKVRVEVSPYDTTRGRVVWRS